MRKFASALGTGLFLVAFLFLGAKGCVVKVWEPPEEPTTYLIEGADGRSLGMTFMPDRETLIVYSNESTGAIEAVLSKMRGSYGTHYFSNLWHLDGPGVGAGLFGLRWYSEGGSPVVMESTVLNKYMIGNGDQSLPSKGERTHPVLLFTENAVRFEGMWLQKTQVNEEFINALRERIRSMGNGS